MITRLMPTCITPLAHSPQTGKPLTYNTAPSSDTPLYVALYITFISACTTYLYLTSRKEYLVRLSSTSRGKPLYPCASTCPFDPIATAPIWLDGSFDQVATCAASARYLLSHLFDEMEMSFVDVEVLDLPSDVTDFHSFSIFCIPCTFHISSVIVLNKLF